jgi:GNAT superfamily N-acetyltransferase
MVITIRSFVNADDIGEIFDLHDRALRAIGCVPLDRTWNDDLYHIHEQYIAPGGAFLLVEVEQNLIGFGAVKRINPHLYEIKRMRIAPEWQRQGIGKRLLEDLVDFATAQGAERLILDTTVQQIGAQKLYENFGFRRYGSTKIHDFDVILYELNVSEPHPPLPPAPPP